jgi:putative ABC transport system ATP-binding protein
MYNLSEEKLYKPFSNQLDEPKILKFLSKILLQDKKFLLSTLAYSVVISLLSLAVPVSVQLLINSVTYTAMVQPLIVIGIILFILLAFSSFLYAVQFFVIEIFQRRLFVRSACEVGMSLLKSKFRIFQEANQSEMVNRFFETTTIQKAIPKLITDSFTTVLRTFVGLALIAFYHPIFLFFSLFVAICVYLIWKFHYRNAQVSAYFESRRKFDLVGWLEDIAGNATLFKSRQGNNYAKFKIDFLLGQYLKERKRHFRSLFTQTTLLLALYVVASTALLMIGGFLVVKEQLTIGQLVAAELVISIVLYEISRFGRDFSNFYDLVASCEKLSQFQNIPLEEKKLIALEPADGAFDIKLEEVLYLSENRQFKFNLQFESGKNYLIATKGFSTKKALIDLIHGFEIPNSGAINFNGENIENYDKYALRDKIGIIDNEPLLEGTVGEYLFFNNREISQNEVTNAIKTVGLEKKILRSKEGLNMRIIPSGFPFSESEKILLKIARILVQKPKIIILTEVLDMLVLQARQNILNYLTKNLEVTLIYFSHRIDGVMNFDEYLFVDKEESFKFKNIEDLADFEAKYFENNNE